MKTFRKIACVTAVLLAACSDQGSNGPTAPAQPATPIPPAAPALAELVGTIQLFGERVTPVRLDVNGELITLTGSEATRMYGLGGAEVAVRGTWDAAPGELVVASFRVEFVRGRAALDGILMITDTGYALRLADGSIRALAAPPESLAAHVGERVWVTGWADMAEVEFGVIPS